ncbi:MAG: cytochrome C oxidase subunit IV family protein [Verrucomicrobia bacterium]|nr:cytochrome C oxidase subunit IV family protein [Verrucomicrobiota bacterium]
MSGHSPHEIKASVRRYLLVFGALIVGTAVTVGAYYIDIPSVAMTVALAMLIASVKAFLVAGYFMHLMSERKMIYGILGSTAFFFSVLMYLTVWAHGQAPPGTVYLGASIAAAQHAPAAHPPASH